MYATWKGKKTLPAGLGKGCLLAKKNTNSQYCQQANQPNQQMVAIAWEDPEIRERTTVQSNYRELDSSSRNNYDGIHYPVSNF